MSSVRRWWLLALIMVLGCEQPPPARRSLGAHRSAQRVTTAAAAAPNASGSGARVLPGPSGAVLVPAASQLPADARLLQAASVDALLQKQRLWLLDAGAAPRKVRRYPERGAAVALDVVVEVEMTVGDRPQPVPPLRVQLMLTPREQQLSWTLRVLEASAVKTPNAGVAAAGSAAARAPGVGSAAAGSAAARAPGVGSAAAGSATARAPAAAGAPAAAASAGAADGVAPDAELMRALRGLSTTLTISARGEIALPPPHGLSAELGQLWASLTEALSESVVRWPAEAVGEGARWRVIERGFRAGVPVVRQREVTLAALGEGTLRVEQQIRELALDQGRDPALPAEVSVRAHTGYSDGVTMLKLAPEQPFPQELRASLQTRAKVVIAAQPKHNGVAGEAPPSSPVQLHFRQRIRLAPVPSR